MSEESKKKVKAVKVVKVKTTPGTQKPVAKKPVTQKQIIKKSEPISAVAQKASQKQTVPQKPVAKKAVPQKETPQKTVRQAPPPKEPVYQRESVPQTTAVQQAPRQPAPVGKKNDIPVYNKWWYWLLLAAIGLALVAVFKYGPTAFKSDSNTNSSDTSVTTVENVVQSDNSSEDEGAISVDENLLTVEVTVPAWFFEDETKEQIEAAAKESGFSGCTVHDDGSVTYKMSKLKRRQILKEYKKDIDETIQEYTSGGENAPQSFKSISYNSNVTQFDVRVDRAAYEDSWFDSMYALGLYILGGYYQIFDGVPNDQIDVVVNFIDDSTGETIESGSLQKAMADE